MASKLVGLALEVKGLSPRAKLVLIAIADATNAKDGRSFPSRKQLAEVAECSVDTVDRSINVLVAEGLLTVEPWFDEERSNRQTSNRYILHLTPAAEMRPPSREDAAPEPQQMRPPQPHNYAAPPAAKDAAPNSSNRKNEPEELTAAAAARDWRGLIARMHSALGAAFDPCAIGTQHIGDLRVLLEPERGVPCAECDIIEAAEVVGAQLAARRETIRSWGLLKAAAIRNRDRRLAGNPDPKEPAHVQPVESPKHYGITASNLAMRERSNRAAMAALRSLGAVGDDGGREPAEGAEPRFVGRSVVGGA